MAPTEAILSPLMEYFSLFALFMTLFVESLSDLDDMFDQGIFAVLLCEPWARADRRKSPLEIWFGDIEEEGFPLDVDSAQGPLT